MAAADVVRGMTAPASTQTSQASIGVAMFTVSDQEAALAFYTGHLGWQVRADVHFGAGGEGRWLEVAPPQSAARLALNPPMGDSPGGSAIGVEVDDVVAEHARLTDVGGIDLDPAPRQMPGGPRMFAMRDPDGNHIWVVSRAG